MLTVRNVSDFCVFFKKRAEKISAAYNFLQVLSIYI